MTQKVISAVFTNGVFKPLEPLSLDENELVELHVTRRGERAAMPVMDLSGLWQGLGDPALEEIEQITTQAHSERLARLLSQLPDLTSD